MSGTGRPEQIDDDGLPGSESSACTALVPVAEPAQWSSRPARRLPPDSTFLTQLIANAEQAKQASGLFCENTADALSAYRTRQGRLDQAGLLTRRMI